MHLRMLIVAGGGIAFAFGAAVACSSSDDAPAPGTGDASTPTEEGGTTTDAGDGGTGVPPHGGSRLAARFQTTADGLASYVGIFDKKLGVLCEPVAGEDEKMRCIPSNAARVTTIYSDDKCTTKTASRPKTACMTPAFAVDIVAVDECTSHDVVYALPSTTGATTLFEKNGNGDCLAATSAQADLDYFPIGAKVAATDLVAFTNATYPAGPGLSARTLAGEDGSMFLDREVLVDTSRNKPCKASLTADAGPRCVPNTPASVLGFTDDSCAKRVAYLNQCAAKRADSDIGFALNFIPVSCATTPTQDVHPLGAKRADKTYWRGQPGSCTGPVTFPPADYDLFDVGDALDPSTFPALTYGDVGGTRVVTKQFTGGDVVTGQEVPHDKMFDIACSVRRDKDGKERCLPADLYTDIFYSDGNCMTPVAVGEEDCGKRRYIIVPDTPGGCDAKWKVYEAGPRGDGGTIPLHYKMDGMCTDFMGGSASGVFPLGNEVQPTSFAEVTVVDR